MEKKPVRWVRSEFGKADSKAPAIITIVVLAIAGFLAYKFIPIKVKNVQFADELQDILNIDYAREYKEYAKGRFNEYTMREMVLKCAAEHKIPIKEAEKQVDVRWPEHKIFTVEVNYTEEINLPLYGSYLWDFHVYMEQDPHAGKAISKD